MNWKHLIWVAQSFKNCAFMFLNMSAEVGFLIVCFFHRLWTDDKKKQSSSCCARLPPDGVIDGDHSTEGAAVSLPPGGAMTRHFRWISRHAPGFRVRGEDVDVLPHLPVFTTL